MHLCATVATLWQTLSMHSPVRWAHTYSHHGDAMNELADNIVAHVAYLPEYRHAGITPCAAWCRHYTVARIKLMYLLFIPEELQYAYPIISADRTAVMATPQSETKWGLPAATLGGVIGGMQGDLKKHGSGSL